jgi:hypothetical protein
MLTTMIRSDTIVVSAELMDEYQSSRKVEFFSGTDTQHLKTYIRKLVNDWRGPGLAGVV